MRVIDVVIEILKREGVEFLSCYPTTPLIDAAAEAELRPIICRQERVGVGIADGFSRVTNGKTGTISLVGSEKTRRHKEHKEITKTIFSV